MSRTLAGVLLVLLAGAARSLAQDIAVTLRVPRSRYTAGETIPFQIVFKNNSNRSLRILPTPEIYYTEAIEVARVDSTGAVERIELVERSMDFEGWSRDVVTLAPNHSYTRKLPVELWDRFPPDWKKIAGSENKPGVYLAFLGASLYRLPSFGKYKVTARYRFTPDHPVNEYISGKPPLWHGIQRSAPILIELASKRQARG